MGASTLTGAAPLGQDTLFEVGINPLVVDCRRAPLACSRVSGGELTVQHSPGVPDAVPRGAVAEFPFDGPDLDPDMCWVR
jgi:hypothetical protein